MTTFQIIWNIQDLDWVSTVRHSKMGLHKSMILKQLERRPEFRTPMSDEDSQSDAAVHLSKMVDEIRALMNA